ncbi:MAG: arabinofuranan 3-O-arabinosyltransferase [Actinomycetota bacterium]|nr:arabinofuranan 3-O-arabinosyltransferase [Actinomycetota bacterium]
MTHSEPPPAQLDRYGAPPGDVAHNGHVGAVSWWKRRHAKRMAERRAQPVYVVGEPPGEKPRRVWAYLTVFVISSFIVSRWFRAGTFISTGDMGAFIRRGWQPEMAWSWNHQISGGGSAAHTIGRAFEFILINFVGIFGFDETVAQWLFYTIIYGGVGFGMAFVAGALVRSNTAVVFAGTFGVMNGFFLTRLPNPLNIISVATIAIITGLAIRIALGRRVPAPVAGLLFWPVAFLAFNPPMFVVAAGWAAAGTLMIGALFVGWQGVRRIIIWQILGAPWILLLNAWWMLPFIQAYTGGGGAEANATFTDPTNWSWSQINNQIPNILTMVANWAWFKPQYLPFAGQLDEPWWIWVRYMLPTVVFLAALVGLYRRRRVAFTSLGLVGLFVFLAKGLNEPFADVNLWLYLNAPMFWLFREPMSKLGQVLVTLFAILIAIFVEGLLSRLAATRQARAPGKVGAGGTARWRRMSAKVSDLAVPVGVGVGMLAAVLALIYPHPLATGKAIPDERPLQPAAHVRVPEFWRDMADTIDSDTRSGKVLVLPLDDYYMMPTTWGFFGVDSIANLLIEHPVITPKPDGYFGDTPGFQANTRGVETALLTGDFDAVPALLDSIGVSEVIVRHDLVRGIPNRSFADDRILSAAMAQVPGVTKTVEGPLELWQVGDGSSDTVRQYDNMLSVGWRPEAAAGVIGSMGTGTTVKPQIKPKLPKGATPPVAALIDNSPSATEDAVQWPVPAVDDGQVATTKVSFAEPGSFQVTQRSRAAPVLVPSVDQAAKQLVLADPSSVAIDGRVVSTRPPLKLPVPRTDIVAVQAGTRFVSMDEWGIDPGTRSEARALRVGAATPVAAYVPADPPAKITTPSDVYDCNNYEPRPTAELQLKKEPLPAGDGEGIRLSAADHAACTRLVVTNPTPGQLLRVRLEYRQVEGKRPQVCVWQVGVEGCARAPRAALSTEWTPFEQFVVVDDAAEQIQIILHADVGERLLPRTVTDYRNVKIEALAPVLEETVNPPIVAPVSVPLTAGEHTMTIEGGLNGSILEPFEPLQDCFRYDDLTADEAGLAAEILSEDPNNPTYALSAKDHMACLGATASNMGASSLYQLTMEARSVKLRNPKICLFLKGPDLCQRLPVAGPWDGWTPYEVFVRPDPGTVETRLYLYGLRDLEGQEQSRVEYREVKLRPVASPVSVVLIREPEGGAAALAAPRQYQPEWNRLNPANFKVTSTQGPGILALAETFAPGWSLKAVTDDHIAVEGWMNGWLVGPDGVTGTITYLPSMTSRKGLYLFPVAMLLAMIWTAGSLWWTRRLRR